MDSKMLLEQTLNANLGRQSSTGSLIVTTGKYTGRSANLRYIARHPDVETTIDWRAENKALDYESTTKLFDGLRNWLETQKTYDYRGYAGAFPVAVHSTSPWHIAFADNMFRDECVEGLGQKLHNPKTIEVWHAPYLKTSQLNLELPSETMIVLDPKEMRVAILGTAYAGEIKKAVFSLCNFALPGFGILPMHASANCLKDGSQSCILFGLSGTGKTTLSASSDRFLIGDDEIIWTPTGISNLEGGCYAKLIDLEESKEPEIYRAVNRKGAIMENVVAGPDGKVDFSDDSLTENTRGSYPITALSTIFDQTREAAPPKSIVFLVADAFGAMPAVAKLDRWQAQYHFLSGYTAKVAGTEIGVKTPVPVFSACFGSPFMPRHPSVYAGLLAEFAEKYDTKIWLLNTGWTPGGVDKGHRYPLAVTRALLSAIQNGSLDEQPKEKHPVFGFEVPRSCPGVEDKWLAVPQGENVAHLARKFEENMSSMSVATPAEVLRQGGPRID